MSYQRVTVTAQPHTISAEVGINGDQVTRIFLELGRDKHNVFALDPQLKRTENTRIAEGGVVTGLLRKGQLLHEQVLLRYRPTADDLKIHRVHYYYASGKQFVSEINVETGEIWGEMRDALGKACIDDHVGFSIDLHTTEDANPQVIAEHRFKALQEAPPPARDTQISGDAWAALIWFNELKVTIPYLASRNLWPADHPHLGTLGDYTYYQFDDLAVGVYTGRETPGCVDLALFLAEGAVWVVKRRETVATPVQLAQLVAKVKPRISRFFDLHAATERQEAEDADDAREILEHTQRRTIEAWLEQAEGVA